MIDSVDPIDVYTSLFVLYLSLINSQLTNPVRMQIIYHTHALFGTLI